MRKVLAAILLAATAHGDDDDARLRDQDPAVRAAAAKRLGERGADAPAAVPQLIDAVYDDYDVVAKAAIRALGRIGPAARAAGPYLVDRARGRVDFKRGIDWTLARIGPPGAEPPLVPWLRARGALPADPCTFAELSQRDPARLRPHLLAALAHEDPLVVAHAAVLLARLAHADKSVVEAIAPLLQHASACVRMYAGMALGHSALAVEVFAPMLRDDDVKRRRVAARWFRGPHAAPYLRRALEDEDKLVRIRAAGAFTIQVLRTDPGLVNDLARLIDRDPECVSSLCPHLAALGPAAAAAVPALARCLSSSDSSIRSSACYALKGIGAPAAPAAVALAIAVFDERPAVVHAALQALEKLGPAAKDAAPYLAEYSEANPTAATMVQGPLAAIGSGAPLPPLPNASDLEALRGRLTDEDGRVAGRAAFAIGRLAPKDAATLDALGAALGHVSPYARMHAAFALGRVGPAGLPVAARVATQRRGVAAHVAATLVQTYSTSVPEQVLPIIRELLKSPDPHVRMRAAQTAGVIGRPARTVVPALVGCLDTNEVELQRVAVWALGRMRADASAAVPALVSRLGSDLDWVLVEALGEIGTGAEAAVPAIVAAAARDLNTLVRASDALVKIGPKGHAALVAIIRDGHGQTRTMAIEALSRNGLQPPGVGEAMQRALTDADPRVRTTALIYINHRRLDVTPSAGTLAETFKNSDGRWVTRQALTIAQNATVATLLEVARHEDSKVRALAWRALAAKELTKEECDAVRPALLDALGSKETRAAAAATLLKVPIGKPDGRLLRALDNREVMRAMVALGERAVPALAQALADPDANVRLGAARVLQQLGPTAAPAATALRDAARKEPKVDAYVRAIAATGDLGLVASLFADPMTRHRGVLRDALVAGGEDALPHVDRLRRHDSSAVRLQTVRVLLDLGEVARPWLLEAVADPDEGVARAALPWLARGRMPAEQAVPVLTRALARRRLRSSALRTLATHGSEALPALADALTNDDPGIRAQVYSALRPLGEAAVELLLQGFEDEAISVRRAAAQTLAELGPRATPALPGLVSRIEKGPPATKDIAATTLNMLGETARPVLPALLSLTASVDAPTRAAAVLAIGRLARDSERARAVLRGGVDDADRAVRIAAAKSLARCGEKAEVALKELLALFAEGERLERDAAGRALSKIGARAAPGLVRFIADRDEARRKSARFYVARIGAAAVPALIAAADKGDQAIWWPIAETLAMMGPDGVDGLRKLLEHRTAAVRVLAAWGIGKFGVAARGATPQLIAALSDKDVHVVSQAAWALGQIGPAAKDALPALEKIREVELHREVADEAIRKIRKIRHK